MGTHHFTICSNTTQPTPAKVTGTMASQIGIDLVIYAFLDKTCLLRLLHLKNVRRGF